MPPRGGTTAKRKAKRRRKTQRERKREGGIPAASLVLSKSKCIKENHFQHKIWALWVPGLKNLALSLEQHKSKLIPMTNQKMSNNWVRHGMYWYFQRKHEPCLAPMQAQLQRIPKVVPRANYEKHRSCLLKACFWIVNQFHAWTMLSMLFSWCSKYEFYDVARKSVVFWSRKT